MRHLAVTVVAAVIVVAFAGFLLSDARGTFPGANGRIAFNSNVDGDNDIYTMKSNGKDVTRLTNNTADDTFPNWSPDGSRIAFVSNRDGNREIYVMDADGGNQTRLTNDPALDSRADWSPDGKKIIFVSSRDGDREIYTMNADGTNVSPQLTNNTVLDNVPQFSPDGKKILFFRLQAATQYFAIFVMNADGSGERQLTPDDLKAAEGDWAPDGKKIIFQDNTCPLEECAVPSDIRVMDADGSNVRRLTHYFEAGGPLSAINPRWSPNGKKIGFIASTVECGAVVVGCTFGANFDIYTMTKDGKAIRNITDSPDVSEFGTAWGNKFRASEDEDDDVSRDELGVGTTTSSEARVQG